MAANLMNDFEAEAEMGFRDYLDAFRRRSAVFLVIAATVFLIALIVAAALPPVYEARSVILIEQQEIPQDLVRSTVTSYADERIQTISQRVMTSTNLREIIGRYDLYPEQRETEPTEVVLEGMREDIDIQTISADVVDPRSGRPTQATIAFTVRYENEVPRLAQSVVNDLSSLFLNENLRSRTEMAQETTDFLEAESEKLADEIAGYEQALSTFKQKHAGNLPELQETNVRIIERLEQELRAAEGRLKALEERKVFLVAELRKTDPYTTFYTENGERIMSTRNQFRVLESELLALKSRYSEDHPSVKQVQREIDALREQQPSTDSLAPELLARRDEAKRELEALLGQYGSDHPEVSAQRRKLEAIQEELRVQQSPPPADSSTREPDNPSYIQIESQIAITDSEIESIRSQIADSTKRLEELETGLLALPEIEREYRKMLRDYETAVAKYQELLAKQHEAGMSRSLEEGRKGERFTLIEPPVLPERPVKPNRPLIAIVGLVLAIAAGFGTVAILESLDTTIYGIHKLRSITGAPPLAAIPVIPSPGSVRRARWRTGRNFAIGIASIAAALLIVHVMVRPLDLLWLAVLRKLGI